MDTNNFESTPVFYRADAMAYGIATLMKLDCATFQLCAVVAVDVAVRSYKKSNTVSRCKIDSRTNSLAVIVVSLVL